MAAPAQPDEAYICQAFFDLITAPQCSPALLRVPERATVADVVALLLERYAALGLDAALPATDPAEFLLFPALGDGSIGPEADAVPLPPTVVLRDCDLGFPVMLGLRCAPANAEAAPTSAVLAESKPRHLSDFEREQRAATRAAVEARRAENVARIEQRRNEDDLRHFHDCESYELRRREECAKERDERRRLKEQLAAQEAAVEARRAEEARLKDAAAQADMERYRQEMQDTLEAERARVEAARRRQEEREAAMRESRRLEQERRRAELERDRTDRLANALDSIIADLDAKTVANYDREEGGLHREVEQRYAEARHVRDLRDVRRHETDRSDIRTTDRSGRVARDQALRDSERFAAEQDAAAAKTHAERSEESFSQWRGARAVEGTQLQDLYELEYRRRIDASAVSQ